MITREDPPHQTENWAESAALTLNNLQHLVTAKVTDETSAENWLSLRTAQFPLPLCALAARHSLFLKELQRASLPGHMMHVGPDAALTARPVEIESLLQPSRFASRTRSLSASASLRSLLRWFKPPRSRAPICPLPHRPRCAERPISRRCVPLSRLPFYP